MLNVSSPSSFNKWFYLFITCHLILWTLVPFFVRLNLPLDAIEGALWGHQLEWGYDKNPFLNGWLTAFATYLGGPSGWMIYLFSQLSVITCFWCVWSLAKKMLPPAYALISVMMLEGMQYYNFHAIDFNDNTLELGLWGLASYFFYQALVNKKISSWLFLGFFAGLGVMAKYYSFALIAGMALFLLLEKNNRAQLKTLPPYLGLITFLAVVLPHFIWLFSHHFITVMYVFDRTHNPPSLWNHIFNPLQFSWQQLQVFLPAMVLTGLLFIGKSSSRDTFVLSHFNKRFLYYVGLCPFLLTALLSVIFGIKLRAGWGMPLLSLWGIIFIAVVTPYLTSAKFYRFVTAVFLLQVCLLAGYSYSLMDSSDESSANFPGREIAQAITDEWRATFHTPLDYVAGSRWVGGNISFYSNDHPAVFAECSTLRAQWIDVTKLKQHGAVFVWEINKDREDIPRDVHELYPSLQPAKVLTFNWKRNTHGLKPIEIGIAFLPPET